MRAAVIIVIHLYGFGGIVRNIMFLLVIVIALVCTGSKAMKHGSLVLG
jgi:hypothetical protein